MRHLTLNYTKICRHVMNNQPIVYIVDDDDAVRDGLGMVFEIAGFNFQSFDCAEDFLKNYVPGSPGCLVLDFSLPGMNGLELLDELNRRDIHLPIIFATAHGNKTMEAQVLKAGAVDFLIKPVDCRFLIARVQTILLSNNRE